MEIKQVILCGFGGQGIVLAGTVLGRAAFNDDKWVSGTNSYGAAARGGSCSAEIVISDNQITFPYVTEADILVAMYQTAYKKHINMVKSGGTVIYDNRYVSPNKSRGLRQEMVPATVTAVKELDKEMAANMVMLGAITEITGVVSQEALKSAITQVIPEKLQDLNLKAVNIGLRLGAAAQKGEG